MGNGSQNDIWTGKPLFFVCITKPSTQYPKAWYNSRVGEVCPVVEYDETHYQDVSTFICAVIAKTDCETYAP